MQEEKLLFGFQCTLGRRGAGRGKRESAECTCGRGPAKRNAPLAQLVEQLTCGIDKTEVLF